MGDVIKAVNGVGVATDEDAKELISQSKTTITLTVLRPGAEKQRATGGPPQRAKIKVDATSGGQISVTLPLAIGLLGIEVESSQATYGDMKVVYNQKKVSGRS